MPARLLLPLLALLALMVTGCHATGGRAASAAPAALRAVLDRQVADWNAGSIDDFMRGYAPADTTRFASGGEVRLGWNTVRERYQKTYADKAAMGRLTFSDLDITMLSADAALVFGRWRLAREKDAPSGLFTLVFRRGPGGWRIVHDHTSAAEKK